MGRPRKKDKQYPPRLHRKGRVFYYVRGGKWTRLSDSYPEALQKWAALEGGSRSDTVGGMLDRFLAEVVPTKAPRTQKDYSRAVANLRRSFGRMGPDEVTPGDIAEYLDTAHQKKRGIQGNREIAVLSTAYSKAIRWRLANHNPCRAVPRNPEAKRQYVPSGREIRKLYRHATPPMRRFIRLSLLTGLRVSDVLKLTDENVTEEGLRVPVGKTGQTILYEWTPSLRKCVPEAVRGAVIQKQRKGGGYTYYGINSLWRRLRARAGIPHVRIHDLRARALTDAHNARGRDYAQTLAAHASGQTTERYIRDRGLVRVRPLR